MNQSAIKQSVMKIVPASEESLIIYVAEQPDEAALDRIHLLAEQIIDHLTDVTITDLIPSFTSLTVCYDVTSVDYPDLHDRLLQLISAMPQKTEPRIGRKLTIPVYYDPDVAPDLQRVSDLAGLTIPQVVAMHCGQPYRVYALGFRPGFAFMGMLPAQLRIPRLDTPRMNVPSGSVAIAEGQTAIYPGPSPGGWNLVGRCPLPMFEYRDDKPMPFLQPGDRVYFRAVSRDEFLELGGDLSL